MVWTMSIDRRLPKLYSGLFIQNSEQPKCCQYLGKANLPKYCQYLGKAPSPRICENIVNIWGRLLPLESEPIRHHAQVLKLSKSRSSSYQQSSQRYHVRMIYSSHPRYERSSQISVEGRFREAHPSLSNGDSLRLRRLTTSLIITSTICAPKHLLGRFLWIFFLGWKMGSFCLSCLWPHFWSRVGRCSFLRSVWEIKTFHFVRMIMRPKQDERPHINYVCLYPVPGTW